MWKNELMEILFSNDPSKLNPKKAIKLKYENTPSSLYKYKKFNDHSLELLKTDSIHLSKPNSFNDPFDCALKLTTKDLPNNVLAKSLKANSKNLKKKFKFSNKELDKATRTKDVIHSLTKLYVKKMGIPLKERESQIKKIEYKTKNDYLELGHKQNAHVACFSETKNSILMWSHYTLNHEGFCIEYDFKELGLNSPLTRFVFPVIYTESIFDMSKYLPNPNKEFGDILREYLGEIDINEIQGTIKFPERTTKMNNMVMFYNALNKFKGWSYEKEWRYVFPYVNHENKVILLNVPKPKAIYLGAKMCKENCGKILEIGKKRGINVYKMELQHSKFALEPHIIHKCHK